MKALSKYTPEVLIAVPAAIFTYSLIKKDSTNFRKSFVIGASILTSAAATYILKEIVNRQRPYDKYYDIEPLSSENSSSFPSMHASTSFSLATSLSLEYPKWYVIVPSYLWATSVSYSRMHLGVHYPSDVLAGALVGAGSAFLCYKINKLLGNKKLAQKIF
jgi:membrane-associated phospholipid phosphatase